jgi:outer membrane protein
MKLSSALQITALGVALVISPATYATTLTDALIQAYQTNPALRVRQSGLRATDETVRQAKGQIQPTVSTSVTTSQTNNATANTQTFTNSVSLTTAIPIYAGGTGLRRIEQSRYNVLAGRQALKLSEQEVLLSAVTAYMDVRRDIRNVELALNSVKVLTEEVRAASERFEVGEVTRTDVSQAESRLAASESSLQTSRADLQRSINFYIATVGSAPKKLRTPPATPSLPKSGDAAEAIAIAKHPTILQQQFIVKAAEKDVAIARGNKSPTASASVSLSNSSGSAVTTGGSNSSIGLTFGQVIYQGGQLNSAERQALASLDQAKAELQLAGVQIRQNVQSAYATWFASKATIQSRKKQVSAAQIAFEGASEEAKLGARTTLDVLNSEQDLLQARSNLVAAIRDEYVNAYTVLSTMGLLTVDHLKLGISSYNPDKNYKKVNGAKKFGSKRLKVFDKIKKKTGN